MRNLTSSSSVPMRDSQGEAVKPGRGRPRDAEKATAIIEAASVLFLEQGFDGTSMDGVARKAGVSKQTVYSHFSSKEQLFADAVHAAIETYSPDKALASLETHTVRDDLSAVCRTLAQMLMSPEASAMYRLLVASAVRGPELGQLFWDAGPAIMREQFLKLLKKWQAAGALNMPDIQIASEQMVALLQEPAFFKVSIGICPPLSADEIEVQVKQAVDAFLKLYGSEA